MRLRQTLLTMLLMLLTALWQPALSAPKNTERSILILATNHVTEGKLQLFSRLAAKQQVFKINYKYLRVLEEGDSLSDLVAPYDLVIFDSVSSREAQESYARFESLVQADETRRFLPIKITSETALRKGLSLAHSQTLFDYYYNGGAENLRRMLLFLENELFDLGNEAVLPPILFPRIGIYHPAYEKTVFDNLVDYRAWKNIPVGTAVNDIPMIGIAMSRETIAAGETMIIDALIKAIEIQGGIAVPFYYPANGESEYIDLLSSAGKVVVDNIINTRIIHWAEKRRDEYEKLGVPVLQVLPYTQGDQAEWEADQAGIPAQVTPFYLTMPEIAGVIDPLVISARNEEKSQYPIDYQLDNVINKALKLSALKHKANADKKVAIMFYNYPAGEKNASASFLNVPASLASIFKTLKAASYRVEAESEQWFIERTALMLRPFHRELPYTELPGLGIEGGAVGLLPMKRYLAWYSTLPPAVRDEIEAQWGAPEKSFTVAEISGQKQFIIPRTISGNVMMLPQPPRGNRQERERSIYHDKNVPVSHNYLAVYFYVREQFGADAMVHLGTHGSHEYLPGKERGLSLYDAGNMAAGDIPIIYPFIMDDVGEALQTKRRGRATVISHLTPPLAKSGLYEELVDLHELMHQYKALDEGGVRARTKAAIVSTVVERNIEKDLAWSRADMAARFDVFLPELHGYLSDLGAQNQPLGLHTFGEVPKEAHLVSTLVQMLGKHFVEPAERYAERNGQQGDHQNEHTRTNDHDGAVDYRTLSQTPEYQLIRSFVIGGASLNEINDDELRGLLDEARVNYANFQSIEENSALLESLAGQYVSSSTGGDPIRTPEALPSGRNLYGFDPSRIPVQAAWESGKILMDDLIVNYYNDHGVYPDKLTFSMWSIETMRHLGVVESQVLYAMGMRPVWDDNGRVTGTEMIPYSELQRPRIDVVLSATGLYRDTFPNIMMMIAKAVEEVATLKEEHNFVYRHAEKLKIALIAEGMDEKEAGKLSTIRIFSNESGNYGTNIAGASIASDTWKEEDKLAKLYLSRMGFFYGGDEEVWGKKHPDIDLYAKNLSGTDAVVFSRSSNVYGLLTSDDPFQYMGGVSLAVRYLDGTSPEMFISNLRDPDNMRNESLGRFLATELRTRQFHPQWIKEIQAEGYAGTLTTLDVLNNFWGWQVVDPDNVRDDQWQEFFEVYVQDKYELDMREWYEENNAHALAQMIERMLEAVRKEYWATDTETLKELLETYIELAQKYDVFTKNESFNEYLNEQAMGFGLAPLVPLVQVEEVQRQAVPQSTPQTTPVEGQKMEKVQQIETTTDSKVYYLVLLIALFFVTGFFYQFVSWPRTKLL